MLCPMACLCFRPKHLFGTESLPGHVQGGGWGAFLETSSQVPVLGVTLHDQRGQMYHSIISSMYACHEWCPAL